MTMTGEIRENLRNTDRIGESAQPELLPACSFWYAGCFMSKQSQGCRGTDYKYLFNSLFPISQLKWEIKTNNIVNRIKTCFYNYSLLIQTSEWQNIAINTSNESDNRLFMLFIPDAV
jgi:hypothetical protein